MLIYGYKGDKCLKSDNCDDYTVKNLKSLYNYIDMVTVVKGLVKYANFNVVDAESVMGMLSLWGAKFNLIMLSMAMGVVVKLVPSLSQSIAKKDNKEICRKVNHGLSITLFIVMLVVFICIKNEERGNARFDSLTNTFNISNCFFRATLCNFGAT